MSLSNSYRECSLVTQSVSVRYAFDYIDFNDEEDKPHSLPAHLHGARSLRPGSRHNLADGGRDGNEHRDHYPGGPLTGVTTIDETGAAIRQVNYAYGQEGETLGVSGSTEPVTYTYDGQYRLSTLTDGNGHTTHYYYKQQGYLDAVTYPGYAGPAPVYNATADDYSNITGKDSVRYPAYDANGNLLRRMDGNGVETDYTHNADPQSLLTLIHYVYPSGYTGGTTGDVSLAYDAYGRRAGMTDGTGSQSFAYDDGDDPLSVTTTYANLPAQSISYGYWPDGSRQSMTTPVSSISYNYTCDAVGRLTGMTNPYGQSASWSYLDNGWADHRTLSNAGTPVTVTSHSYDPRGELTGLQNRSASNATLSDYAGPVSGMVYDGAGNRTAWVSSIPAMPSYSRTMGYTYDGKNQLTQETSTAFNYANGFGYDSAGNITSFKGQAYTYNADNQDTANTYDGNGNPTVYNAGVYGGQSVRFDPENRMTRASSVLSCGYNGDGQRAWKQNSSGARTYFVYDGSEPVCELDGTGAVTATNTFGANGLLSRHTSAGSVFYACDLSGNVAQRANASGVSLSADQCDAFGVRQSTASAPDVFGFGGQWGGYTDAETGLVLMTHRFYDPNAGRFLTRDPIGYDGGINLYAYVGNNPVNEGDPSGLASVNRVGPRFPPQHYYIVANCYGNPSDSYGFWPKGGNGLIDGPGEIEGPGNPGFPEDTHGPHDPTRAVGPGNRGDGTPIITNNNPGFEHELCRCIQRSQSSPPLYGVTPNFYTCYNWAFDIWACAINHTSGHGGRQGPGF